MTLEAARRSTLRTFAAAMTGRPCTVHGLAARPTRLPMHRWAAPVDDGDVALLRTCTGPVLDLGCGPGRMAEHLAALGLQVLGVDVVPEAVAATRARGVAAVRRDLFGPLPAEGSWRCVLLADGNIGIGGDPVRLLRRVRELLAADGRVVVDLDEPGTGHARHTLELECEGLRSEPFPWSRLGPESMTRVAARAGLRVDDVHQHGDRWFAVLSRGQP